MTTEECKGNSGNIGHVVNEELELRPAWRHCAPARAQSQERLDEVDAAQMDLPGLHAGKCNRARRVVFDRYRGEPRVIVKHDRALYSDGGVEKQDSPRYPDVRWRRQLH
eukprot:CAMPEP_0183572318 /NCGR_PEP_ID=MMETSP0371-20130417/128333_1 /TAXON_ID=268820 /ORGANISM="Peridinium aciculiferum, Strain PAER-2" /LENGTH=108 /DNA_ID=CAMNT_0025782167 /DNA_START=434 /DNA_END=757 /DNA_ORIENTATION=+